MYFDNPKMLGICVSIKERQSLLGSDKEIYKELIAEYKSKYLPLHNKVLQHFAKYKNTCGNDNSCFAKYISASDGQYLSAYYQGNAILKKNNEGLSTLDTMALQFCGTAVTN